MNIKYSLMFLPLHFLYFILFEEEEIKKKDDLKRIAKEKDEKKKKEEVERIAKEAEEKKKKKLEGSTIFQFWLSFQEDFAICKLLNILYFNI